MLPLSRRALPVLAGMAGLTGLAAVTSACDPFAPITEASGPSHDERVVSEVLDALRVAHEIAVSSGAGEIAELHAAQLRVLGDVSDLSPRATPSPSAGSSLSQTPSQVSMLTLESDLRTTLAEAAATAESGSLARILASMAAAVAQRLTALR